MISEIFLIIYKSSKLKNKGKISIIKIYFFCFTVNFLIYIIISHY